MDRKFWKLRADTEITIVGQLQNKRAQVNLYLNINAKAFILKLSIRSNHSGCLDFELRVALPIL